MTIKQKMGCLFGGLRILVISPIWYYLIYSILRLVQATDIMWFLFWIYLPVGVVISFVEVLLTSILEEK